MLVAASATNGDVFMLDSALSYATGTEATRLWYAYITAGPDVRESLSRFKGTSRSLLGSVYSILRLCSALTQAH